MKHPTLADGVMRGMRHSVLSAMDPTNWVRNHIAEAKRFIIDDDMSSFMADLAYASLPAVRNQERDFMIMEGLRTLARIPHKVTWIEYNRVAATKRAREVYGESFGQNLDEKNGPDKCGWLIIQHPQIETAFMAIDAVSHSVLNGDVYGTSALEYNPNLCTYATVWCTDDRPLPWKGPYMVGDISQYVTGLPTYRSNKVGTLLAPWVDAAWRDRIIEHMPPLYWVQQFASQTRYLWALLAAINDIPLSYQQVSGWALSPASTKPKYRQYLSHTVIKLVVPQRFNPVAMARKVMIASRRRAHDVRGHWRLIDHFDDVCARSQHQWSVEDEAGHVPCQHCKAYRTWIKEHSRGDASIGFVSHDYEVTHKEPV